MKPRLGVNGYSGIQIRRPIDFEELKTDEENKNALVMIADLWVYMLNNYRE